MRRVRDVIRMKAAGLPSREIARRVGAAPSTVRLAIRRFEAAGLTWPTQLPDRPISPHPNLVTPKGFEALRVQLGLARDAYEETQRINDAAERRRQGACRFATCDISRSDCARPKWWRRRIPQA
jgi:hypothetical protein